MLATACGRLPTIVAVAPHSKYSVAVLSHAYPRASPEPSAEGLAAGPFWRVLGSRGSELDSLAESLRLRLAEGLRLCIAGGLSLCASVPALKLVTRVAP